MAAEVRWAVVTGATSGIGAAFARRLAREGYALLLHGRRAPVLEALAAELHAAFGVPVEVMTAELAAEAGIEALAERVRGMAGLALLVNNAGFGTTGFFQTEPLADQAGMIRCHTLAPMMLTHAALPGMLRAGRGAIINVSSMRSFGPGRTSVTYSGTKAFVNNFTKSLALELKGTGIQVQALCPGFTTTEFHSRLGIKGAGENRGLARWMTPDQVVDASLRGLARDRVICIPGLWNRLLATALKLGPMALLRAAAPATGGGTVDCGAGD